MVFNVTVATISQGSWIPGVAALSLLLAACGKTETAKAPPPALKPTPAISDAKLDAEITQALTPSAPEPEADASDSLADEVTDLRRRHPGKNAQQLLEVPEVKEKLGECLKELMARKDLQNRINASVAAAASLKGLDTAPGTHAFKMDLSGYSDQRTDQLLRSVMSGSATRVVDFLVGEVGEAVPDLSLGGLSKSFNGISIDPVPPPQKP